MSGDEYEFSCMRCAFVCHGQFEMLLHLVGSNCPKGRVINVRVKK